LFDVDVNTAAKIDLSTLIENGMPESVRYIINEGGERVGVVLDLDVYQRLANPLALDADCLVGLSADELRTLANCKLSTVEQAHLDNLLARNAESQLSDVEVTELDRLLAETDYLMILKARARYTLKCLDALADAA
jgi:hypothetical protein